MTGRGSWSTIGGTVPASIGGRTYGFYERTKPGVPLVGSAIVGQAQLDTAWLDYRAVHAAVTAYQRLLNGRFNTGLVVDGVFGPATSDAVNRAQLTFGMTDLTPGRIGHTLSTRLMRDLVSRTEALYGLPGHALYGIGHLESDGYDLGCVGTVSEQDKGAFQFHVDGSSTWWMSHFRLPEVAITSPLAFDPYWATGMAGRRMRYYLDRFADKGPDLQLRCAILQHNAPGWAQSLFDTGQYPNDKARAYVSAVQARAASF